MCHPVGVPAIEDDHYCCPSSYHHRPGPDSVTGMSGEYTVWYRGAQRTTGATIDSKGHLTQPGIFTDKLHTANIKEICNQPRDAHADFYILGPHGTLKYECVRREGDHS